MPLEIELKVKVENLLELEEKIKTAGAKYVHTLSQVDYYLDTDDKTLLKRDSGLRLRVEKSTNSKNTIICFKGPKSVGKFKNRKEFESIVSEPETILEIFQQLGYNQMLAFEKKRDLYRFMDCDICLDRLPLLGEFVEIEGPNEVVIEKVANLIEINTNKHISRSYAAMMDDEITEQGFERREFFF